VSRLQDLDERWVPAAARRVGALANRLRRGRVSLRRAQPVASAAGPVPQQEVPQQQVPVQEVRERPLERLTLRELDARYTARGPLAVLRDIPQVGFIVIGLVFLAGTGTAVSRQASNNRAASQANEQDPSSVQATGDPGTSSLGPQPGDAVSTYVQTAGQALVASAKGSGGSKPRVALVSLTAFSNQQQAVAALAGYDVLEVYLRSTAGGKEATELAVPVSGTLATSLVKSYADAARGRLEAQKSYQGYVDTLTVTTKEDQQFKDYYRMFATSAALEATAYAHNCACVYAAVVRASPKQLLKLTPAGGVRAVQVASQGLGLKQVQVFPLLPSVKGVVPEQQTGAP
jgi:hypothetical protein